MTTAVDDTSQPQPQPEPQPPPAVEQVAVLKHRRGSRWMHWINFPLLTIMIWSGLRIYWADVRDPFGFGVGVVGWHWFDFLPDVVNERLGLERRLARGLAFHFTFGWLFVINGVAYAIYTWRTKEWRHLLPDRYSHRDAVQVVKHDLFIRNKPLPPQGRYNGAQRWSYTLVLGLGLLAVLSGFAIYRPTQLNILTTVFGGYESARTIHFFVTIGFLVFFVVHILQVVRAGWRNFASMISGYELVDRPLAVAATGPAVASAEAEIAAGSEVDGAEVSAEPAAGDEPEADDKPEAGDESEVDDKPAAGDEPEVDDKPEAGDESEVDDKPAAGDEPEVDDKPEAGVESEVDDKPEAGAGSEVDDKPAVDDEHEDATPTDDTTDPDEGEVSSDG